MMATREGSACWRTRWTRSRISRAVSTRRSRRLLVEGLGQRAGRKVVVAQFRGRKALVQGRPEEDQDDDVGLVRHVGQAEGLADLLDQVIQSRPEFALHGGLRG